ncbi:MAG: septum formation initiator family protein [Rickettsiales bacterium]|nr:septum formation initiator family protein [Rickettsiales bacterium]
MRIRSNSVEAYRNSGKSVWGSLLLLSIMFYLAFHAVSGERGVLALFTETRKLDEVKTELARVKAQREKLEHKTHLMSDSSLDLDLLDEQVRKVLGMANKNEVVYFPEDDSESKR